MYKAEIDNSPAAINGIGSHVVYIVVAITGEITLAEDAIACIRPIVIPCSLIGAFTDA